MSCDIAVFFSTNLYNNKALFTSFANELIKQIYLIVSLSARLYFFAQNCKICLIRGPPVLFEHKKSNKTQEERKIETIMDKR